jgi:chromosome segregation ATPase
MPDVLTFEQRAFRQRKERYITELEEKVKQFETMETDFRSLQDENHQLREYILSLQSQLLEQTREPSSVPSSPPRRRRDVEQAPDHVSNDRIAPPSLPPNVAAQSETTKSGSWSEHIDNLRQRYSEYPAHRSSIGGSASYTPEEKRIAKD